MMEENQINRVPSQSSEVNVNPSKKSIYDKVSYVLLLTITALAPIFFVPVSFISTQYGTSLLFAFGAVIAFLLFLVSGLLKSYLELPNPSKYILGFMSVVPVVYLLAGISNGFSRMTFLGYTFDINTVGFILLAFIYMFLVSIVFRTKERVFNAYFAFVVSSIIFSLWILMRIIWGAKILSFGVFTDITSTMLGT